MIRRPDYLAWVQVCKFYRVLIINVLINIVHCFLFFFAILSILYLHWLLITGMVGDFSPVELVKILSVFWIIFNFIIQELLQLGSVLEVCGRFSVIRPTVLEDQSCIVKELIKGFIFIVF